MAIRPPTPITITITITTFFLLFFLSILHATPCKPGFGTQDSHPNLLPSKKELHSQGSNKEGPWRWRNKSARRLLIGSTAPICTYNECRGCRFKCSAEQVPVDAGDPMNSAYHYQCVCHR